MLQVGKTIGTIEKSLVKLCRKDNTFFVLVEDRQYTATYQQTDDGNLTLLKNTYPLEMIDKITKALTENMKEIKRNSIEMLEATWRVPYIDVLIDQGYAIMVGQSNSMTIYIKVQKDKNCARLQYADRIIKFTQSNFTQEESLKVREIVVHNMKAIVAVMVRANMVERKQKKENRLYVGDSTTPVLTEEGKKINDYIDKILANVFEELDARGFSNLEIQYMLMESVFENSIKHRTKLVGGTEYA